MGGYLIGDGWEMLGKVEVEEDQWCLLLVVVFCVVVVDVLVVVVCQFVQVLVELVVEGDVVDYQVGFQVQ